MPSKAHAHTHTRRAREEGATSQLGRWCNGAAYSSRAAQLAGTQSAVEDEAPAGMRPRHVGGRERSLVDDVHRRRQRRTRLLELTTRASGASGSSETATSNSTAASARAPRRSDLLIWRGASTRPTLAATATSTRRGGGKGAAEKNLLRRADTPGMR